MTMSSAFVNGKPEFEVVSGVTANRIHAPDPSFVALVILKVAIDESLPDSD